MLALMYGLMYGWLTDVIAKNSQKSAAMKPVVKL